MDGRPTGNASPTSFVGKMLKDLNDDFVTLDELARCLDRKFRVIKNWQDLAEVLGIPTVVQEKCSMYMEHSPTERLFNFLQAHQPSLTVKALKDALENIDRVDVCEKEISNFTDDDQVAEVITSSSSDVLDNIALKLDTADRRPVKNWKDLACELKISREQSTQFEMYSSDSPTILLFRYLYATQRDLSMDDVIDKLKEMDRNDIRDILEGQTFEGGDQVSKVVNLDSDLLRVVAQLLNKDIPATGGWRMFGSLLGVPSEILTACDAPSGKEVHSPTKRMLVWQATTKPCFTVEALVSALEAIQRQDAIKIICEANKPQTSGIMCSEDISKLTSGPSSNERIYATDAEGASSVVSSRDRVRAVSTSASSSSKTRAAGASNSKHEEDPRDRSFTFPVQASNSRVDKSRPTSLPGKPGFFYGRDEELKQLTVWLTSGIFNLIEVCALPGLGKTTLVVHVGHDLNEQGWSVLYVDCLNIDSVDGLAEKIIHAIYGECGIGDNPCAQALTALETLDRDTVLIIENLDELLHANVLHKNSDDSSPAASSASLEQPASHSSSLRGSDSTSADNNRQSVNDFITTIALGQHHSRMPILVTSKEHMDFIDVEVKHKKLEPLDKDNSGGFLRSKVSSLNIELEAKVVSCCGGVPLLLCVALALLQGEEFKMLSNILEDPLCIVERFSFETLPRSRRINDCLNVCFGRMERALQEVFVMVSVFPGPFTETQAKNVVDENQKRGINIETCLRKLKRNYRYIKYDNDSNMYSLHSVMRSFASTQAENKKFKKLLEAARQKFIAHFRSVLLSIDQEFFSHESKSAIQRYQRQKQNIEQVIRWCIVDRVVDVKETLKCIDDIIEAAVFLFKMMTRVEYERLFCRMSLLCKKYKLQYSNCLTYIGAKIVLSCIVDPPLCKIAIERALQYLREANNIQKSVRFSSCKGRAQCLSKLGRCLVCSGESKKGFTKINKALEIRKMDCKGKNSTVKCDVMLAACYNDLAAAKGYVGEHKESIRIRTDHALPTYEKKLEEHPFNASTQSHIARSYLELKEYGEAVSFIEKGLKRREVLLGDHQDTARSLFDLGLAYLSTGEFEKALQHLQRTLDMQKRVLETPEETRKTLEKLVVVLKALKRDTDAEAHSIKIRELESKGAGHGCDPPSSNVAVE